MQNILSKHESLIKRLVKGLLKKNPPLDVSTLTNKILSKLSTQTIDISHKGVNEILKTLYKQRFIVEGSKLTKDDILNNKKRKILYKFIKNNPSLYNYQIIKALKYGNNIVVWHLNVLLDFHFIKKATIDSHTIYFDNVMSEKDAKRVYYTNNKKCQEILKYLKKSIQGTSKTNLSKSLNMHPTTIKKYIEELEILEVVSKKTEGSIDLYYLTNKL